MASGTLWGNTVQGVWRCYAKWSDSSTNTTFTMNMTTGMRSLAYGFNIHSLYADSSINNSTNSTNTASFYSATGATVDKDFISKSVTVNRTHSTQTIHAHASVVNNTGFKNGRSDIYTSWTVPAKPSYTVSYNANGGSGAPGNQTKWYGETLTLSSTKPSRTGHSFQGWATSSGGSVAYASGANYTGNAALTLYAVWKANTYAVKYNANGGTGAPGQQTKTYGVTLKLSSTKPTRTNYNFKGWATSATGAVAYQPGANYTANAAVTLYAIWEIAYIAPTITNVAVDRCNSAGTITDDGTYLKVSFSYKLDSTYSGGMDYIRLGYKLSSSGSYTNLSTYTPTAMSGSFGQVIGGGLIDTEYPYDVQIIVKDHKGSSTVTRSVGAMSYIIDFSPQGGVAIGEPAPNSKQFVSSIPSSFKNTITLNASRQGFYKQGLQGSTTQYLEIARAGHQSTTGDRDSGSGQIRVYGTLGGYGCESRGHFDIIIIPRNISTSSQVRIVSRDSLIGYTYCNLVVYKDTTDHVRVYIVQPARQYFAYNVYVEGFDMTTPNELTSATPSGTKLFDLSAPPYTTYSLTTDVDNHIYLRNNIALSGRTTSNSIVSLLRMNTSNQVELNWTSGGLKGRVMKQIWSGTWSSGSITVSELPYYNVFLLLANYWGTPQSLLAARNPSNNKINGTAGVFDKNATVALTFFANASGTTLTGAGSDTKCCVAQSLENTAIRNYFCQIDRIYGLL